LKEVEKLAAEDAAEDLDGKEEGILGMNPAGVAWVETAGGNDAVEMRMQPQVLSPGMQDAEEADFGSEVLGVAGNLRSYRKWRGGRNVSRRPHGLRAQPCDMREWPATR
jgi:hypothetical protein